MKVADISLDAPDRLREIVALLALGLIRLRARQLVKNHSKSGTFREVSTGLRASLEHASETENQPGEAG